MNKFITATILLTLACPVMSQEGGYKTGEKAPPAHKQDAGYKGTEDTTENQVKALQNLKEGSWVTLEGNLIEKDAPDRYTFRDKTGTLTVLIRQPVWKDRTFDASDLVRISGRVSGQGKNITISVERLDEP